MTLPRGEADLALASVTALPAALGALVCYGIGTSTGNVAFSAVIQSHVPDRLRGRVFSAFDLIWQSIRLVSLLLGGLLTGAVGIRGVYYLGGFPARGCRTWRADLASSHKNRHPDPASRSPRSHGK